MPEFDALTTSARSGAPTNLFTFTGRDDVIRYSDLRVDAVIGGDTYIAQPIKFDPPEQNGAFETSQIRMTLPAHLPVVQRYVASSPGYTTWLDISRYQRGDPDLEVYSAWNGIITAAQINGSIATLQLEPALSVFKRQGLRRMYQNLCNHVLYDDGCGVNKELFRTNAVVTAIAGLTIQSASFASHGSDWYTAGYVETTSGEKRLVLKHTGDTLTLLAPFPPASLAVSDTVSAFAGCLHDFATCIAKFNNAIEYGGFPFITEENIFVVGLRL